MPFYKTGEKIGGSIKVLNYVRGGFGDVYFCIQDDILPVVMKTPHVNIPLSSKVREVIHKEAENWIALGKHPNIVQCYMLENFDATPFLQLEWIMGNEKENLFHSTLSSYMNRSLGVRRALEISLDICRGLSYMQEVLPGIVHQDLKPSNILIDDRGIAKITDFGLAEVTKQLNFDEINVETSQLGILKRKAKKNIAGTPPYMAPEQFDPNRQNDFTVDIYALGCIMFEMLVGYRPFEIASEFYEAKDFNNQLNAWKEQHLFVIPSTLPDSIPESLQKIISKCLAKRSTDRFDHPTNLLNALENEYKQLFKTLYKTEIESTESYYELSSRGRTFYNIGKDSEALEMFNKAIELNDKYADAYIRRGQVLCGLSNVEKGMADINRGLQLEPDNGFGYSIRGSIYSSLGDTEHALEDYKKSVELEPEDHYIHEKMGQFLSKIGNYKAAIDSYILAIETNPHCHYALAELGKCYREIGEYGKARVFLEKSIELNPYYGFAYAERGELFRIEGNHKKSIDDFSYALLIDSADKFSLSHKAVSIREQGDSETALQDLNYSLEIDPNDEWAIAERGITYQQLGFFDKALEDLKKSVQLKPDGWVYTKLSELQRTMGENKAALLSLAFVGVLHELKEGIPQSKEFIEVKRLWADKNYNNAFPLILQIIENDPNRPYASFNIAATLELETSRKESGVSRYYLSILYFVIDMMDKCLEQLKYAILIDPSLSNAYKNLLELCEKQGALEKKLIIMDFLCENFPLNSRYFYSRGEIYREENSKVKLSNDLIKAIQLDPKYLDAYIELGIEYRESKNYKMAIDLYSDAISNLPKVPVLYNNRGNSYHDLEMFEEALIDRSIAIDLDPNYHLAYFNRGNTYKALNQIDKAIADYIKCIELEPSYENAYYPLSEIYIETDQDKIAFTLMQHFIQPDIDNMVNLVFWFLQRIKNEGGVDTFLSYFPSVLTISIGQALLMYKKDVEKRFGDSQFSKNYLRLLQFYS